MQKSLGKISKINCIGMVSCILQHRRKYYAKVCIGNSSPDLRQDGNSSYDYQSRFSSVVQIKMRQCKHVKRRI